MELKSLLNKIEPFIAIFILITLIFLSIQLYEDHKLKKEISINCGFGEEDYYCYCEKSKATEIKNLLEGKNIDLNFGENKWD